MLRALRTAALGMSAQQNSVDNTANNIANANTTGYKRSSIVFNDLLYQNVQARSEDGGDGSAPASMQMGHGASAIATVRNFGQGSMMETGNTLDIAINGAGFIQVRRPRRNGRVARDGSLALDADGTLVTQTGLAIEPDISVPPEATDLRISQGRHRPGPYPGPA